MMMEMMETIEKGKRKKKKKSYDEYDDRHYWTKADKGFYGHSSAKEGFAKVNIVGRGN